VVETSVPQPTDSDPWPLGSPSVTSPAEEAPEAGGPATTIKGRRAWQWALAADSPAHLVAMAALSDLVRRGCVRIGDPAGALGLVGLDGVPPRLSIWRGSSTLDDLTWQESDFVATILPDGHPVEARPHALSLGTRSLAEATSVSRPRRRRDREQREAVTEAGRLRRQLDAAEAPASLGHDRWTLTGYAWGLGLRPRWAAVLLTAGYWTTADVARRVAEALRPR
jgi:hypothetical protein